VAGWLEPVLSWPRRFIVGFDALTDLDRPGPAPVSSQ